MKKLHCGWFYYQLERDYVIYVHIDVNLDGIRGRFAAAPPAIVRKETGGALARNQGQLPFNYFGECGVQLLNYNS